MQLLSTPDAPKPVAAYSQAVISNGWVYCSGQIGIDPETSSLAPGLEAQAQQVFKNLDAVLAAAGSHAGNLVKVNIFIVDLAHFSTVNAVYERFVGAHRPARTTVGVSALPAGALIEVDAIAALQNR